MERPVGADREPVRRHHHRGIARSTTRDTESALGDLIADAQLAATSAAGAGGAQMAFMNPGGVRADLDVPVQRGG